jgi:hypothetical protein
MLAILVNINLGHDFVTYLKLSSIDMIYFFDAVTFSRIDPGEKFVIGFRRASGSIDTQVMTRFSTILYIASSDNNTYIFFA